MMNEKGYDAERLQTLATFLAYAKVDGVRFDMSKYSDGDEDAPTCGTVGCAVGWASLIWKKPEGMEFGEWSTEILLDDFSERWWEWCFDVGWSQVDNTRLGAAKRIQYFLDHGADLPNSWTHNAKAVALYQNTVVKNGIVAGPSRTRSQDLIAGLMEKIAKTKRELAG